MESLREHAKIATSLYCNELDLKMLKEFPIKELENCCKKIEENYLTHQTYLWSKVIQKELVKDTNIIKYLIRAYVAGITKDEISEFIETMLEAGDKMTNYDVNKIINVLLHHEKSDVSYAYLKYFIDKVENDFKNFTIIENLNYFFNQDKIKIQELTEEELKLFTLPILSDYNLIPNTNLKLVYELLVRNKELKKFILFLYRRGLKFRLEDEHYKRIDRNAKLIFDYVHQLSKVLNNDILYRFLYRWIENKCNLYDLRSTINKIEEKEIDIVKLYGIFGSRSGYINFIYGSRINSLNLNYLTERKEELIIYAIVNNKSGFLKLIEQYPDYFSEIPSDSILFDEDFYSKYVNINAINSKNLKDLQSMLGGQKLYLLQEGIYTFNEIKTLHDTHNKRYYEMYNYLLNLKVDERLIRIKQIINKNLLDRHISQEELEKLSEKISIKALYSWLEQEFKEIKDITANDVVKALMYYEEISRFIGEIKDRNELLYILRNKDNIAQFQSLQEAKDKMMEIDKYWKDIVDFMELTPEFIEKYQANIREFLLRNGTELAYCYYNSGNNNRETFKLILKAELMGQFKKLKYHTDDLNKELSFELTKDQINEWINNTSLSNKDIEVGEFDDFYSTMLLGEEPMETCLSYRGGMYNRCLLACFDSNKKILYARINGKIVARAMVRLTKVKYKNIPKTSNLSFVDVEDEENDNSNKEYNNEILTIFLERAYISGISSKVAADIERMFIKLLEIKAKKMQTLLTLSYFYEGKTNEEYTYNKLYMYISKSKAGEQYLDSLNGAATIQDEDKYKSSDFWVWKVEQDN